MLIVSATAEWWRSLSRTVKIIGYVGVVMGAITATATAFPIIEPWLAATRGYVRESHAPLLGRVIEIQIAQNDARSERLVERSKQYELELQSPQAQQLPQYRKLLQERVDRTSHELKIIDEQNKSLFREKLAK